MKKIFCTFLAIVMLVASMPISIYAMPISDDKFNEEISDMLSDFSSDSYYGEITIDVRSNTISVDNGESIDLGNYDIDYSALQSEKPMIPVVPVLELAGNDASFDKETGEITVDEESYDFYETENELDNVTETVIENGIKSEYTDSGVTETPVAYIDEEQAQDSFNLDMSYDDGIIKITNKFQSKRIIVQTKGNVALRNTYDAVRVINNAGFYILQYETEEQAKNAYERFGTQGGIESVYCDKVNKAFALEDRTGAKVMNSDGYKRYLADNGKSAAVTVAVLDTGCETSHSFLAGRLVKGYDVYKKSTTVTDSHGHGTHVSGIVADNSPSCVKIMPIKVLSDDGSGTDLAIKQGIEYAVKNNAKVINMSLGGFCDESNCLIEQAVKSAVKSGVTVVVAAGNDACDCKDFCPASVKECITVASYSQSGTVSGFSNFGDAVDLCAPGSDILSSTINNSYEVMSGTSMATPFVAAAAAMELVNNSSLKPSGVLNELKSTCADMFSKGWDRYSGAGLLNYTVKLEGNVNPAIKVSAYTGLIEMNYFEHCTWYKSNTFLYGDESSYPACTDYTFTSTSSDPNVAVYEGLYFIPKGAGQANITISLDNGKSTLVTVVVNKIEVWTDYAASSYGGGNGTKSSPYLIYNAQQLAKLARDERTGNSINGKYYKLMSDIDLAGKQWVTVRYVEYTMDFIPGSMSMKSMSINFDGNNHKIKNMTCFSDPLVSSWSDSYPVNGFWYNGNGSLFGDLFDSSIKNLGVENAYSVQASGILANVVYNSTVIENCYTTGYTKGNGLFGAVFSYDVTINNCYSSAFVGCSGMMNYMSSSTFGKSVMTNCFFCGIQLGNDNMSDFGGLIDNIEAVPELKNVRLYNCFTTEELISGIGLCSLNKDSIMSKCYYNSLNRAGVHKKLGVASQSIYAKSSSFFKTKSSYTTASNWNTNYNWDFTNVWAIDPKVNNGYPYLRKNKPTQDAPQQTGTWLDYTADSFAGGNGTKSKPYIISNASQLARVSYLFRYGGGYGKYFELTNDIDLSERDWFPIGGGESLITTEKNTNNKYCFQGNIDGNGHTITGIRIDTTGDFIGFASKMSAEATINNLNFENVNIKGGKYVGAICGVALYDVRLQNCHVSGKVSGNNAGSITGNLEATSHIVGCSADAVLSGESIGGICDESNGVIRQTFYSGTSAACFVNSGVGEITDCYCDYVKLTTSKKINIKDSYYTSGKGISLYYIKEQSPKQTLQTSGQVADFKSKEAFPTFDFENVWAIDPDINNGLPYLISREYSYPYFPEKSWDDYAAKSFASGSGTKEKPYIINTAEELALAHITWNTKHNVYFKLGKDIDLAGKYWNSNIAEGIISQMTFFFDGANHKISNVYMRCGTGLFDVGLVNGIIANVHLRNVRGTSDSGLLNFSANSVIKNCSVEGDLSSPVYYDGRCSDIGGIVYHVSDGTVIERCRFSGNIEGGKNTGQIAAFSAGEIRDCYTEGTVHGVGASAICDNNSFGKIYNCYTTSVLFGASSTTIANIYFYDCYYSPILSRSYAYINSSVTTEELQQQETYKNWDFENVWQMGKNGYPELRPIKTRTITYVTNGGTLASGSPKSYTDSFGVVLKNPTKNGAVFGGWFTDSKFTKKAPSDIGIKDYGNITLYAKWTPAFYVSFNGNGATSGKMSKQTIIRDKSTALTANAFKKKGYIFQGWAKTKNGKVVYKNKASVKNIAATGKTLTLYAIWKPIKYNVKFNGNGIAINVKAQKNKTYDVAFKLPSEKSKSHRGVVFGGWGLEPDKPKYTMNQSVKNLTTVNGKTVTLYACWVGDGQYNIKYYVNKGTMPKSYPKSFRTGKGCKLPVPTRKGYTFAGWYTDKACTKNKSTVVKPWIEKNMTYYAKWVKKK